MSLCYECYEKGKENELKFRKSTSTLMHVNEFFDDNAVAHRHDPNLTLLYYECDAGHKHVQIQRSLCVECGWPVRGASDEE